MKKKKEHNVFPGLKEAVTTGFNLKKLSLRRVKYRLDQNVIVQQWETGWFHCFCNLSGEAHVVVETDDGSILQVITNRVIFID